MTMETVKEPSSQLSDLIIIDCSKGLIFCSGLASLKNVGRGQRGGGREKRKKERNILGWLKHSFVVFSKMVWKTVKKLLVVQLLSCVQLFATPWTSACQASLSFTISQSLLKLMSIELVMPSSHLILCCPLLLLPPIFPNIRSFPMSLANPVLGTELAPAALTSIQSLGVFAGVQTLSSSSWACLCSCHACLIPGWNQKLQRGTVHHFLHFPEESRTSLERVLCRSLRMTKRRKPNIPFI